MHEVATDEDVSEGQGEEGGRETYQLITFHIQLTKIPNHNNNYYIGQNNLTAVSQKNIL